jgi:GTP-binding protein
LLADEEAEKHCKEIVRRLRWKGPVFRISGLAHLGTEALAQALMRRLEEMAAEQAAARAS